ncbi:MAG: ComEC/Rec2 family competence protein [Candidatus Sericytochromatia bacterium]|nr:ComEC/Rec2 family competence protein [Candidatus Sericytochromatia bacterium]
MPQLLLLFGLWGGLLLPEVGVVTAGAFLAGCLWAALPYLRHLATRRTLLLLLAGAVLSLWRQPSRVPELPPGPWTGTVRVREEPRVLPWGQAEARARIIEGSAEDITLVWSRLPDSGDWAGRTLRVEGRPQATRLGGPRLRCLRWRVLREPSPWNPDRLRADLARRVVTAAIRDVPVREAGFLRSLLFGAGAPAMTEGDVRRFRDLGLSHVLAVSGFQVSLLAGILSRGLRPLASAPWFAGLLLGLVTWTYAGLCGFDAAVSRAAAMATAVMLARASARPPAALPALLLGVFGLLLVAPGMATSLGLAFSTLATWGILTAPRCGNRVFRWWWPGLWAQLWCLPLQLAIFGTLTPWGLVVGPAVDAGVTVLTLAGFLRCLLGLIGLDPHGLTGPLLGQAAGLLLRGLQPLGNLPGTPCYLPLAIQPVCATVLGGLLVLGARNHVHVRLLPAFLAALLAASVLRPVPPVRGPMLLVAPHAGTAWLLPGGGGLPALWLLPTSPRAERSLRVAAVRGLQARGFRQVAHVVGTTRVHPGPVTLDQLAESPFGPRRGPRAAGRRVASMRLSTGHLLVVADRTSRKAEAQGALRLPPGRRLVWWRPARGTRDTVLLRPGDVALVAVRLQHRGAADGRVP